MPKSKYNKPFLEIEDQISLLEERGMSFKDKQDAFGRLQSIGYYRLSGYWYPFRLPPKKEGDPRSSNFKPGTSFEKVLEIYEFDSYLRMAILSAISIIEVAIRARIGYALGQLGAFSHLDSSKLEPEWFKEECQTTQHLGWQNTCMWEESRHHKWVRKLEKIEEISNEAFIAHFHKKYGKPLPIWVVTEIMTFEQLNLLFSGMRQNERQQIAVEFDLLQHDGSGDAHAFSSWIEHIRQTRNYCAHHARLWNRNHTAPFSVPSNIKELQHLTASTDTGYAKGDLTRPLTRIYGSLSLIIFLLARVHPENTFCDSIVPKIEGFFRKDPDRIYDMGFPEGWENQAIWQPDYQRDADLVEQANLLRGTPLLYAADAGPLLPARPEDKFTGGRSSLNYYRKNGALLSVPGVKAHRYPAFQFNRAAGDLFPAVIEANRILLNGSQGTEEERWSALKWWNTAVENELKGKSPQQALIQGELTPEIVRSILR
ncbi:Abi family protein [uncultured Corynebacterium sp.]|uniref:Abi family protein n=1 Tax=uncultured Corynebacterium sp. TaxID=159447 RepID=UPI00288A476E|nr:Abi family protein [uncultured Corynebacterium sp.]